MSRPSDWHVIDLEGDPTPGDPFQVRELARTLLGLAADAGFAGSEVRRLSADGGVLAWVGEAGAVFATQIGELPGQLGKLEASYDIAGRALKSYGEELETAQGQADGALSRGREAHARLVSAREQLASAQATETSARAGLDALTSGGSTPTALPPPTSAALPPPGSAAPPPEAGEVARATRAHASASSHLAYVQRQVSAAEDDVDAEKRLALAARSIREEAARTCTTEINRASDAGIQNDSWWKKAGDFLSDAWNAVVEVAKVVVLVLGVVVLIIGGPLAWVVLAAGLVLLVDALIKYGRGEGSLWDVGLALLGCIPGTRGLTTLGGLAKGLRALRANPAAFARGFLTSGRALLGRMATNVRAAGAYTRTTGGSLLPRGMAVTPDGRLVMMAGDTLGDAHRAGRDAARAARGGDAGGGEAGRAGSGSGGRSWSPPRQENLDPRTIRFSQENVSPRTSNGIPMEDLVASIRSDGWQGAPIDVVDLPDGNILSIDNRRLFAAREAGLDEIPTMRHHPDEPFPVSRGKSPWFTLSDDIYRLPDGSLVRGAEQGGTLVYRVGQKPSTWGEAVLFRTTRQPNIPDGSRFPLWGRIETPRIR